MRALVTGFDQGLGEAIKWKLQAHKYQVVGTNVEDMQFARGHKHSVQDLVHDALDEKPVDLIVNNFGINHLSFIGDTPPQDEDILLNNAMTPYWVVDYLVRHQKGGKIVNIASQTARVPQRCTALYCASKAAVVQMTRVMARELAPCWQVNSLSPGKIEGTRMTELTDNQVLRLRQWDPEEADSYAKGLIPMGRFTDCDEVTDALMHLVNMPKYVTGINLEVMGGV